MKQEEWRKFLKPYSVPVLKKSSWQLVNTLVPFVLLYATMLIMVLRDVSLLYVLPLAIPAGLFMVRIFILFHDCTHGSFFASRRANMIWGYFLGLPTFTPYNDWQHSHALHHGSVSNLDKRGVGDVPTMTIKEYREATLLTRLGYRLIRNPLILFILGPTVIFLIANRFPQGSTRKKDLFSIFFVNLILAGVLTVAWFTIGITTFLIVHFSIFLIGGSLGLWLFYVQHQFQNVYWARSDQWDPVKASFEGSSFYRLPGWLNWFTGSIGYHHIHHLNARIPNYNLKKVYNEIEAAQEITPMTLAKSLNSLFYNLYDEEAKEMVSFRQARIRSAV